MTKIEAIQGEPFVLEMTHEFAAPRERVFAAFSTYEAMSLWFGPHGCHVTEGELDFKVGGRYRLQIQSEENEINAVGGVFREIESPERLVFSWRWEPREDISSDEMEVTIRLEESSGGKTALSLRQTRVPTEEVAEHHGWGWGETFERLEQSLL